MPDRHSSPVQAANGSHAAGRPGWFEWWYFHFVNAEGTAVTVLLHDTDIFARDAEPYVSATVRLPDHGTEYFTRPLPDRVSSKGYNLRTPGLIWETRERIRVDVRIGTFRLQGTIHKRLPPFGQPGALQFVADENAATYWFAGVPHAPFTGTLSVRGRQVAFEAFAYHDHNWGSVPLHAYVHWWAWGHLCGPGQGAIFYHIQPRESSPIVNGGLATSLDHGFEPAVPVLSYVGELMEAESLPDVSCDAAVRFRARDAGLVFSLQPDNVMRSRTVRLSHQTANYCRWFAAGDMTTKRGRASVAGVTEYLKITG